MFKSKKTIFCLLISLILLTQFLLLATPVQATGLFNKGPVDANISKTSGGIFKSAPLPDIIATFIKLILGLIGVGFFIYFLYGSFLWMTAAGNPSKVDKAKSLLLHAIIGLIIITFTYAITVFISNAIQGQADNSGTGGTTGIQYNSGATTEITD